VSNGVTCESAEESLPGRPSQHWLLLYAPFQMFPHIGEISDQLKVPLVALSKANPCDNMMIKPCNPDS